MPAVATDAREAIRMAAAWYARQNSGSFNKDEHTHWRDWLDASELHRQAWQQVEGVCANFAGMPGHIAGPALRNASAKRRQVLRALLLIGTATPLAWLGQRVYETQAFGADLHTAIGERRPITLADGSRMVLDTDSAVDVRFDPQQRLLRLRRGRILISTARPAGPYRPFLIETAHGRIEALGTRFTVLKGADSTLVAVLDERVRVSPADQPETAVLLHAGQQLAFSNTACGEVEPASASTGTWAGGSLLAIDMPLDELLAELGRYRRGFLRCDPAVARLLISGAFPLDDTERALQLLTDTFPVRSVRHTRFWVEIQPS